MLKGAAHITGGGLVDNVPRILPDTCDAVIDTAAWKPPRLCQILQEGGKVPREEMFQVFNMGVGMALVVAEKDAAAALEGAGPGSVPHRAHRARHGPDAVGVEDGACRFCYVAGGNAARE